MRRKSLVRIQEPIGTGIVNAKCATASIEYGKVLCM